METENKKDRGFKIVVIIALLLSVVCLSYAFAQYTSILRIQGTGTVKSDVWEIYFTEMDNGTAYGTAELPTSGKFAITNSLTVSGNIGTLTKMGDSIVYNWKVKNAGGIDATLATIARQNLVCTPSTGSEATQAEANNLCNDLKLTLTYDGTVVAESNGTTSTGTDLTTDLLINQTKDVQMKLEWLSTSTVTVSGEVDVSVGMYTFTYVQK